MLFSYYDIKNISPSTLPFAHSEPTGQPLCLGILFYMQNELDFTKEIWAEIKGYNGRYHVSNYGRVRTTKSTWVDSRYPNKGKIITETIMKHNQQNSGYDLVHLVLNTKRKAWLVHRLVATYFIKNPNNKEQVNHVDCNKKNNHVDNLQWVTLKENSRHAWDSGLMECARDKARVRMSTIGKQYSKINGQRLIDAGYSGSTIYNKKK